MPDWLRSPKVISSIVFSVLIVSGALKSTDLLEYLSSTGGEVPVQENIKEESILIKFIIVDRESRDPIENVTGRFIFDGAPVTRYTDSDGYVSVEIPIRREVQVRLSSPDHRTLHKTINLEADAKTTVEYRLERNDDTSDDESDLDVERDQSSGDVLPPSPFNDAVEDTTDAGSVGAKQGQISTSEAATGRLPQQNSDGYYFNSSGWDEWRVVALKLVCHKNSSLQSQTVSILDADELVYVNREVSDPIALDGEGKPWLKVDARGGTCFARARSRYIVPLSRSEQASAILKAKSSMPRQNNDGYYFNSLGWEVWRVIPLRLSCRDRPSLQSQAVSTLISDSLVRVSQSTRSALVVDSDDKPWLQIDSGSGSCFVKARSRYVIPSQ